MVTRKIKVETNSWIRDAPRMLEQTQMPYAALVDSQDEFIGIISRSRISEAIQTALDQLGGR
jgi:predicted transcriptional regulator